MKRGSEGGCFVSWNRALLPRVDVESGGELGGDDVGGSWVYGLTRGEDRSTVGCPCVLHRTRLWGVGEDFGVGEVGNYGE